MNNTIVKLFILFLFCAASCFSYDNREQQKEVNTQVAIAVGIGVVLGTGIGAIVTVALKRKAKKQHEEIMACLPVYQKAEQARLNGEIEIARKHYTQFIEMYKSLDSDLSEDVLEPRKEAAKRHLLLMKK